MVYHSNDQQLINGYINRGIAIQWISFGNKKEWSPDTFCNMDEPRKYYAKWKKPIKEDHIFYYSFYIKCPEKANL